MTQQGNHALMNALGPPTRLKYWVDVNFINTEDAVCHISNYLIKKNYMADYTSNVAAAIYIYFTATI